MQNQVLIVGAGPTGLALALFLAKQGVKARIIDKNAGPGEASRAMAVQARTLEFYQQIGIAQEVVNAGFKQESLRLRSGGRERAGFNFSNMGKGLSPFPYVLSYPQDDHEKLLGKFLKSSGVEIEWNTTLLDLKEDGDAVKARIATNLGEQEVQVAFLCGCDGTHSTVRESLGLKFPGGTYEQMLYVADVQASGQVPPDNEIGGFLDSSGFCLVFSIRSSGHYRLIGLIPQELLGKPQLSFEDIKPFAERTTGVRVEKTFWSSVYHSHHRVVEHFRVGRVFIAGDAGHVHSPVGGQGMNTGIGDAVNLAWKLASVLQGRADQSILASYEPERITFARALVNTTDRFFNFVTGPGLRARIFRDLVFKRVVPLLLRSQGVRRKAFRIISQTRIHYRESPLSCGAVRRLHGGDRLPWVESLDNYAPLKSLDWQVHIYGQVSSAIRDFGQQRGLPIHALKWSKGSEDAGFDENAMYLVRPDGHIALADKNQDVSKLTDYLDRLKVKSGAPVGYSPTT